jgi:hypothetical protein
MGNGVGVTVRVVGGGLGERVGAGSSEIESGVAEGGIAVGEAVGGWVGVGSAVWFGGAGETGGFVQLISRRPPSSKIRRIKYLGDIRVARYKKHRGSRLTQGRPDL